MPTIDQPLTMQIRGSRDAWTTLRLAIPRNATTAVANRLHVTPDQVRRWRRERLSDEAPLSTGQRSPLDRVLELLDAVFLSHPLGASLIVEHIRDHHDQLLEAANAGPEWDRKEHAAHTLRETAEAVNSLFLEETPDEDALVELVEARDLINEAIRKIQSRRSAPEQAGARVGDRQEAKGPARLGGFAGRLGGDTRR